MTTEERMATIYEINGLIHRLDEGIFLLGFADELEQFLEDAVGDTDKKQKASDSVSTVRWIAFELSLVYITDVFDVLQYKKGSKPQHITKEVWENMPCSIKETESKIRLFRSRHTVHLVGNQSKSKHSPEPLFVAFNILTDGSISPLYPVLDVKTNPKCGCEKPSFQELLNICRDTKNILDEERRRQSRATIK